MRPEKFLFCLPLSFLQMLVFLYRQLPHLGNIRGNEHVRSEYITRQDVYINEQLTDQMKWSLTRSDEKIDIWDGI
jgi:hypothetical protein